MELDEKIRKRILHTVLNEQARGSRLLDFFRERRNTLIAMPAPLQAEDGRAAYKQRLGAVIGLAQEVYDTYCTTPLVEGRLAQLKQAKEMLELLSRDIQTGLIDLERINPQYYKEWGGANLIVTTTPDRSHGRGDIVVYHEEAHVIVWLTRRLYSICGSVTDYLSKYALFERIGETAGTYLNERLEKNRAPNLRNWCAAVIEGVDALMSEWIEYAKRDLPQKDRRA